MLKAGALVLIVLGVLAGAAGGVGLYLKPDANVVVAADLGGTVAVVPAGVVALVGDHTLTFDGQGAIDVRTARPVDAQAWLAYEDATVLTGIDTWTQLGAEQVPASASSDATIVPSDDIWRTSVTSTDRATLTAADVEPGATVVVVAHDGGSLSRASLPWHRDVGFTWIVPALSGGALLTAVGLVMLVIRFLDMRPAGEKVETAAARIRKRGKGASGPGIRRARREAADAERKAATQSPATTDDEGDTQ